jgi:hypothetical protein
LHEFYPEYFSDFLDFEKRKNNYLKNSSDSKDDLTINRFIQSNCSFLPFDKYDEQIKFPKKGVYPFLNRFLICFGPTVTENLKYEYFYENGTFLALRLN